MEDDRVFRVREDRRTNECVNVLVTARLEIVLVETVVRVLQYRCMGAEILHQLDDAIP